MANEAYALPGDEYRDFKAMLREWRNNKSRSASPRNGRNPANQNRNAMVKVRITSVVAGRAGIYNGKLITDPVTTDGSNSYIDYTDLGDTADKEDVFVWNLGEVLGTDHVIDPTDDQQTCHIGLLSGFDDDSGKGMVFISGAGGGGEGGFWAIITGHSLVAGNTARWAYTFVECTSQWTTTGKSQVKSDGRTGTAYNTVESGNPTDGIGTLEGGFTTNSTGVAAGYKVQPIANGTAVWIREDNTCNTTSSSSSSGGSSSSSSFGDLPPPIYLFQGWNVKGDCDTPGVGGG